MDITRRSALTSIVSAGAVAGLAACSSSDSADDAAPIDEPPGPEPKIEFPGLPETLLLNRARAYEVMKAAGVEAMICTKPQNIYYLTNYNPQLVNMGMHSLAYAILPLDPAEAPILIVGQFAFYLAATERATPEFVDVRLFTSPAEEASIFAQKSLLDQLEVPANPSFMPTRHDAQPLKQIENSRREITRRFLAEMSATSEAALAKAVQGLALVGKRVGVDDHGLAAILERAELPIVARNGERLIRDIRLQKSEAEIVLARYAAQQNAEASLAAAQTVRDGASFQDMRLEYKRECSNRFLTPQFMVIDGIIPDAAPGQIEEGRAFLIDCVSEHQNYHGDYGRTVCVGEPTREMARATDALGTIWDALLPQLKPGLRYSEIRMLAAEVHSKTNTDGTLICNPHSVGLNHTDEPGMAGVEHWMKDDLELVEDMVLSVDLPMVDVGLGGSAHLEDLVLITADGAELLNDAGDRVIIV